MREIRSLKRQAGYWTYVAAALGSALSSLFAGSRNQQSAKSQMRFQERMRNTQYSAAMEDMRRAGLNPMLAYDQGGAGTPAGAGWQTPDPSGSVSSAIQAVRTKKELEVMDAGIDKSHSETAVNLELAKKVRAEAQVSAAGIPKAENWRDIHQQLGDVVRGAVSSAKKAGESAVQGVGDLKELWERKRQKRSGGGASGGW